MTNSTKASDPKKYKEGNTLISFFTYKEVMNVWSVFTATDINNDHNVSSSELRMLLWTYEGEQPS